MVQPHSRTFLIKQIFAQCFPPLVVQLLRHYMDVLTRPPAAARDGNDTRWLLASPCTRSREAGKQWGSKVARAVKYIFILRPLVFTTKMSGCIVRSESPSIGFAPLSTFPFCPLSCRNQTCSCPHFRMPRLISVYTLTISSQFRSP